MGRGRTTTGMVSACLIASTIQWEHKDEDLIADPVSLDVYDPMDGPSEEEAYLAGMFVGLPPLLFPNSVSRH